MGVLRSSSQRFKSYKDRQQSVGYSREHSILSVGEQETFSEPEGCSTEGWASLNLFPFGFVVQTDLVNMDRGLRLRRKKWTEHQATSYKEAPQRYHVVFWEIESLQMQSR